ncbi:MAG: PP2C family protein-serine/threonine phosphatase [Verrucomicrobia bacterium]|nr:PP2C family protein-serine/threonine phosphatase [Verrucomicrobiota bacterium]
MRFRSQLRARVLWLAVAPVWVVLILLAVLGFLLWPRGGPSATAGGISGVLVPLFLVLLFLVAGAAWTLLCFYAFRRFYDEEQHEMLQAGEWVLNRALGRRIVRDPKEKVSDREGTLSPVQQNLNDWLKGLVEEMREKQKSQSLELQRDMSLAQDFQQAYMDRPYPSVPAVHIPGHLRLTFAHRYQPASALGGDFYNIVPLASDCAGVFIADVMGHGTRSALITAIVRTLMDDLIPQGRNARHFVKELNRQFCVLLQNVPGTMFASAFYFVADTTSRVATFASAGHPAPIYVHRGLGQLHRLDVPMPRGAALGVIPEEDYTAGYCRLNDGDLFVFFTDGLFEAHNEAGEEFGIQRMEKALMKLMYQPGKVVVDGLMDAVLAFVGKEPVADDICIVAVEVSAKATDKQAPAPTPAPPPASAPAF